MAFAGVNMFAMLDDENEEPGAGVAAAKSAAKEGPKKESNAKPTPIGERPNLGIGGGRGRGRGRGERQFAPREFEGEVVGADGGRTYNSRGGRGDRGGRGGRGRGDRNDGEDGARRPRREYDRRDGTGRGHEGPRRGGAGKGNWGTEGEGSDVPRKTDEAKDGEEKKEGDALADSTAEEAIVEEEPDNEMTLEEAMQAKAEKKKAMMEAWAAKNDKKIAEKTKDSSAFKGLKTTKGKDDDDENDDLAQFLQENVAGKGKSGKSGKNVTGGNVTLETGFKTAPTFDDREDRGDRGFGGRGRGRGRGDRDGGRGGRGGRGGGRGGGADRGGGRGGFNAKIDDDAAFPTLGGK